MINFMPLVYISNMDYVWEPADNAKMVNLTSIPGVVRRRVTFRVRIVLTLGPNCLIFGLEPSSVRKVPRIRNVRLPAGAGPSYKLYQSFEPPAQVVC